MELRIRENGIFFNKLRLNIFIFIILSARLTAQDLCVLYTDGFKGKYYVDPIFNTKLGKCVKTKTIKDYHFRLNPYYIDTVAVSIEDSVNGMNFKFAFNQADTLIGRDTAVYYNCNYQQITFDKCITSQKYLSKYQKKYGFKRVTDNKYLSKYKWSSEMEVLSYGDNNSCVILVFRPVRKKKEEYLKLYKSLNK
jgi:hypothetical protein